MMRAVELLQEQECVIETLKPYEVIRIRVIVTKMDSLDHRTTIIRETSLALNRNNKIEIIGVKEERKIERWT